MRCSGHDLMALSDRELSCQRGFACGDRKHPFEDKEMICAVLVIVPGDGVTWCQCKNPRQDIAAFQHRLDGFDFVRIGCGHNDVLPMAFKQISASSSPPLALPYGDVRFTAESRDR